MYGIQWEDLDNNARDLWRKLATEAMKAGFGDKQAETLRQLRWDSLAAGKAAFEFHKWND